MVRFDASIERIPRSFKEMFACWLPLDCPLREPAQPPIFSKENARSFDIWSVFSNACPVQFGQVK
jgi:hypothetical protein